jgi:hypothetical protein
MSLRAIACLEDAETVESPPSADLLARLAVTARNLERNREEPVAQSRS